MLFLFSKSELMDNMLVFQTGHGEQCDPAEGHKCHKSCFCDHPRGFVLKLYGHITLYNQADPLLLFV